MWKEFKDVKEERGEEDKRDANEKWIYNVQDTYEMIITQNHTKFVTGSKITAVPHN